MDRSFPNKLDSERINLVDLEVELTNIENRDLSNLTAEEQYEIIIGKVAGHPEAITPRATEISNELLERLRESKEMGRPLSNKIWN